jgi:hypothetical protein
MRPVLPWAALAAAAALGSAVACGRAHGAADGAGDDGGDEAGLEAGDDGAVSPGDDGGSPGQDARPADTGLAGDGGTVTDCDPAASLVYVVSEERFMYSFDPQKNVIAPVGSVDCAGGSFANSMSVDRSAVAWINYGDGSLWKVDTKKLACVATTFEPNQQGVGLFGMAFATKTAGGTTEQLFIDDLNGNGLGYIDTTTLTLQLFGPLSGSLAGRIAELTGTGDARLFGFFAGSPLGDGGAAEVAQIDPNTETALATYPLPSVDTGSDWAVTFWGGDFYLYTADKYDANAPDTNITRFRPSDGSLTVVDTQIGFRAVGAASSTCAPTTPAQ